MSNVSAKTPIMITNEAAIFCLIVGFFTFFVFVIINLIYFVVKNRKKE